MISVWTKIIVQTEGAAEIYDLERDPFELDNLATPPSAEQLRLINELTDRYLRLVEQGDAVGNGEIQPEFVEELKALGYL